MANSVIKPTKNLKGEIRIPGDKSISHRAVMIGSIADGETIVNNFLMSGDCLATIGCFKEMGIDIEIRNLACRQAGPNSEIRTMNVIIKGNGLKGLKKPGKMLDVGNSGTTIRLISGILAGQNFETTITGDASIQKRPMRRIVEPLFRMGARIEGFGGMKREKEGGGGIFLVYLIIVIPCSSPLLPIIPLYPSIKSPAISPGQTNRLTKSSRRI
jgi:3-phosphoshikimate 1-carboxyvinyltransferase